VTAACLMKISGRGFQGYVDAMRFLVDAAG